MFEGICNALHREMEVLEDKYRSGNVQLNNQDLEHIDLIAHALKSIAGYEMIKNSEDNGRSRSRYDRREYDTGYYDRRY